MSLLPIKELIVDKKIIRKISSTIKKYHKNPKPILLVGPTGVGKTTVVLSVAKSLNYKVTNIDPDSEYTKNKKNFFIKKELILLDNLDEITGKEVINLVNYFVKDGRPLIMCTSEVHKNLQSIKSKLKIRATNFNFDLTEWINYLTEKYEIDRKKIKHLVRQTQPNKGIAINQLELSSTDLNGYKLTHNMSMWEVFENVFNKEADRSDYYFRENMLPIFVFENYPKLKNNKLEYCANTASACAIIDVIESYYKRKQYHEFMPYVNILTTEMATFNYNQKLDYVKFPSYYGKMKKKVKDSESLDLERILKSKRGKNYIKTPREEYEERFF